MTRVNFRLQDFSGMNWPAGTAPVLSFTPSGPGVDAWGVYAAPVVVPGTSSGVDLAPTVAMHGDVYYSLDLSWVESGVTHRVFWPHKIRVPEFGPVELFDIVDIPRHELYQLVEVSDGTTDFEGNIMPHSKSTNIWLKTGAEPGIYMEVS